MAYPGTVVHGARVAPDEARVEDDGLVFAGVLDGRGGARALDWEGVLGWRPSDGVLWVDLDYERPGSRAWLTGESGVDLGACAALLAGDPRPRVLALGDSLLLILREVNENLGAQPEDMVSIRMWVEP